jgi:phage recombination protein Bet
MNNVAPIHTVSWTSRQLDTIKRTVAADTNESEFDLFVEYAKVKKLDPFSKQVIAVVFSKDDPKKRRMSIIVTQDGQRILASRCRDYRPAEDEPTFIIDPALKSPVNPLGVEKATVTLFKQDNAGVWHPVKGWAYWSEYAPTREEWAMDQESGKRKPTGKITLDASGNWAKMPRVMLAKCANMVALRAGWPETFDGVYSEEEMERSRVIDLTASEMVEQEREERRKKSIAMSDDEYPFVDHEGTLRFIPAGRYGDEIIVASRNCKSAAELESAMTRNREGLQRFWAKHKPDALDLREQVEKIRVQLTKPESQEAK